MTSRATTTVRGLLEAAASHAMFYYYSERWTMDTANGHRVEWVGTMLGRLADRGLVEWPESGMSDTTITPYGKRYLAWLRDGRKGTRPVRS